MRGSREEKPPMSEGGEGGHLPNKRLENTNRLKKLHLSNKTSSEPTCIRSKLLDSSLFVHVCSVFEFTRR